MTFHSLNQHRVHWCKVAGIKSSAIVLSFFRPALHVLAPCLALGGRKPEADTRDGEGIEGVVVGDMCSLPCLDCTKKPKKGSAFQRLS